MPKIWSKPAFFAKNGVKIYERIECPHCKGTCSQQYDHHHVNNQWLEIQCPHCTKPFFAKVHATVDIQVQQAPKDNILQEYDAPHQRFLNWMADYLQAITPQDRHEAIWQAHCFLQVAESDGQGGWNMTFSDRWTSLNALHLVQRGQQQQEDY